MLCWTRKKEGKVPWVRILGRKPENFLRIHCKELPPNIFGIIFVGALGEQLSEVFSYSVAGYSMLWTLLLGASCIQYFGIA